MSTLLKNNILGREVKFTGAVFDYFEDLQYQHSLIYNCNVYKIHSAQSIL